MRNLVRAIAVLVLVGSAAACIPAWPGYEAPTPTPSPTPLPALDAFKATVASSDFQAQGSVSGTVKAKLILGSTSGSVTGTFKVKGGDSDVSVGFKILGATATFDNIVAGGWSYSRANGGEWAKTQASGQTLQALVGGGVALTDEGVEPKFGRQLHHLTVDDPASVDPAAFGITAGVARENLAISALSFWAESDGTPAGLSIEASLDQKILGTQSHETVTLDIAIDRLWGVTITAPVN
jgi:hypothetical protein